jgi:hypothetical protein
MRLRQTLVIANQSFKRGMRRRISLSSISTFILSAQAYGKWRHCFAIYDRHFRKFVGRTVDVVEIGVFSGGSFMMWREYFGSQA